MAKAADMTLPGVGNYFQSDSINDRHFVRKSLEARRARFESGEALVDELPASVLQRRRDSPGLSALTEEQDDEPRTASAAMRRSASEPQLPSRGATGASRSGTGVASVAASSQASRFSVRSSRSLRGKIGEAVEREVARSALGDYLHFLQKKEEHKRNMALAMPIHLRTGPNPIDMGCPRAMETETQGALSIPVKKAVDPRWSTELKKINDRVGQQIKYQQRLSAPASTLIPELRHMFPKPYLSNPPTPYFRPGQRER